VASPTWKCGSGAESRPGLRFRQAPLGAKRRLDGVGENIDTMQQALARLAAEFYVGRRHGTLAFIGEGQRKAGTSPER
jgi:hypothetical protein